MIKVTSLFFGWSSFSSVERGHMSSLPLAILFMTQCLSIIVMVGHAPDCCSAIACATSCLASCTATWRATCAAAFNWASCSLITFNSAIALEPPFNCHCELCCLSHQISHVQALDCSRRRNYPRSARANCLSMYRRCASVLKPQGPHSFQCRLNGCPRSNSRAPLSIIDRRAATPP